jgi:hypothetical protein
LFTTFANPNGKNTLKNRSFKSYLLPNFNAGVAQLARAADL